jgi:hypothetical protein
MTRTLSRRACLKGAGVALALPWLEAMAPRRASAQTKALRLAVVYAPNGIRMDTYRPKAAGLNWEPTPTLEPLRPFKGDVNVISGLANYPASIVSKEFAGSHARGAGALLTQAPLAFTSGSNIKNGVSLDQILAEQLKAQTALPSLELGIRAGSAGGDCEDGFSCAYLHNLSWSTPTSPMKKLTDPRAVFQRLFAGGVPMPSATGGPGKPDKPDNTALYEASVLDVVAQRSQDLQKRLGRSDRVKLDEYFTMVRSVEERLRKLTVPPTAGPPPAAAAQCTPGPEPAAGLPDYAAHVTLMLDLMVLAFQCDRTRVITFMMEDSLDTPSRFGFLGVSGDHHNLSHHGGSAQKLAQLAIIDLWYAQRYAYFLGKLKAIKEGDASLLDNCIALYTSEFGDGDDHYHWDLPVIVGGRAGGRFRTGQHVVYPHSGADGPSNKSDMPLANLYLNVLQAFGNNRSTFGTDGTNPYGTKPLAELWA